MNKIINVISNIITYLTLLIVLVACIFVIPTVIGIKPFIVQSGSMEPVINTGGVAFIDMKHLDAKVNDIVTYKLFSEDEEETLVTHRIVEELEDGMYLTKGDANETVDMAPISKDQIVGVYKYQIPKVGFIIAKLNKKVITMIVMWIVILNIMSIVLSSVFKDSNDDDNEKDSMSNEDTDDKTAGPQ